MLTQLEIVIFLSTSEVNIWIYVYLEKLRELNWWSGSLSFSWRSSPGVSCDALGSELNRISYIQLLLFYSPFPLKPAFKRVCRYFISLKVVYSNPLEDIALNTRVFYSNQCISEKKYEKSPITPFCTRSPVLLPSKNSEKCDTYSSKYLILLPYCFCNIFIANSTPLYSVSWNGHVPTLRIWENKGKRAESM